MVEVNYSKELLVDFNKLLKDFNMFMTLNLVHTDKGLSPECQVKMSELIRYSLDNSNVLVGFFKEPLLKFEQDNKDKLIKNLQNIIKFLYSYLEYAEPILKICRPDIYSGRFLQIKTNYANFSAKYLQ